MRERTPSLSVVIPTYKRALQVMRLLHSLGTQSHILDMEVLVVTNFADPKLTAELKGSTKPIQLLVANKRGVNASRNLGLERSRGSVILFLDDDCVLHKRDFLRRVLNAHRDFPDVQVIGGSYESSPQAKFAQHAYNLISTSWCEAHQYTLNHTWALLGGNISYKSSVRDGIYRFNEGIAYGGSETEFHVRLFEKGFQMKYMPELAVEHTPEVSSRHIFYKAIKQAETAHYFQFPKHTRATDLCKYIYTQRSARLSRTQAQFKRFLEVYRLHEDAFLRTNQYRSTLPRYKRLFDYHRKFLLC